VIHNEVKHNEVIHNEVMHNEVKHNEVIHNEVMHNEVIHNEVKHNEVIHNEVKHNEVIHNEVMSCVSGPLGPASPPNCLVCRSRYKLVTALRGFMCVSVVATPPSVVTSRPAHFNSSSSCAALRSLRV